MKRLILTLSVGLLCLTYQAKVQWTVIDPSNLAQSTKSVAQNSTTATNMVKSLQESIRIYNQGRAYHDALKSVHNITKDARKMKLTLEMVSKITGIHTSGFNRMVPDSSFMMDELAAISAGYARLLEEGGALVVEFKTVVTGGNSLSLSDKERVDMMDQVYTKMLEYCNFTRYYTHRTTPVFFTRSRKKSDAHRVLAPRGDPNDRYW